MKRLIVNGDDFGIAPGVNQGILDAHQRGIVTSTTVMINYPDAGPGIERALAEAPRLGLGLHLNLTSGVPVSPRAAVASLLDGEGRFFHIQDWPDRLAAFEPDHVRCEIDAQVARFVAQAGRPPDHLDSHHHAAYLLPEGLESLIEIAARYHIPARHVEPAVSMRGALDILRAMMPTLPEPQAAALIERQQEVAQRAPAGLWPARLEMGFFGDRATLGDLLVILTTLPDDSLTEIMSHPGYPDDGLARSRYVGQRALEVDHLTHAATRECVRAENIALMTFGDLLQ